jgi:hypothetical protein
MFSSVMARIAAGLSRQGMKEQFAFQGIAGNDPCPDNIEILS